MKTKRQWGRVGSRFQDGKAERVWSQQTLLDHIFAAVQTCSCSSTAETPRLDLLPLGWQQEYSHLCTAGEGT